MPPPEVPYDPVVEYRMHMTSVERKKKARDTYCLSLSVLYCLFTGADALCPLCWCVSGSCCGTPSRDAFHD